MAKIARTKRTNKSKGENSEIRRAAERMSGTGGDYVPPPRLPPERTETDFQKRVRVERQERYAADVSRLVTGGLFVSNDEGDGCSPERAILHSAGAMAKAIMISLGAYTDGQGPRGWSLDSDEMTDGDLVAALSGLVSILQCAPRALDGLRDAGTFRDSLTRWETLEKRGETEEVLNAAEGAS